MVQDSRYFACFISMSDLKTDARTLNVIRTLTKQNKRICAIAYGNKADIETYKKEGFDFIPIEEPHGLRAYKQWLYFSKKCKSIIVNADVYWAADIYSLKTSIRFANNFNSKIYYDSREIYSAIGSLHKRKFAQKIQTILELKWVQKVDKIVVSGELDKDYLINHFNTNSPFYVIKNLPKYKNIIESNLIREKYNVPKTATILIYQGMLSQGRGIYLVLESLRYLPNHYFVLMGDGVLKNYISEYSKVNNLSDRVILAGIVDYDSLHEWTCSADIGISLIEDISFSYKLALPNKLFEYCMAGIPSVVSDLPAMKKVIDDYKIGIVIPDKTSAEELAEYIKNISSDDNIKIYKDNCLKATKELSYEAQESIINELFNL